MRDKDWWRFITSFVQGKTLYTTQSPINPHLEVRYMNGRLTLNAQNANYSFGNLHRVFYDTFEEFQVYQRPIRNALILGLGAGSIVKILVEDYGHQCPIKGVEIDPEVIRLGRDYFELDRYQNLQILQQDAFEYVETAQDRFDLIAVDLFLDRQVPEQAETAQFVERLSQLLAPRGLLVFNRMFDKGYERTQTQHFLELFEIFFQDVILYHTVVNLMIVVDRNRAAAPS
jgi:hypothetical protein